MELYSTVLLVTETPRPLGQHDHAMLGDDTGCIIMHKIVIQDVDMRVLRGKTYGVVYLVEGLTETNLKESYPEKYETIKRGMLTQGAHFIELKPRVK